MNIKSNKEDKKGWSFKPSFKFRDYIPLKMYLIIPMLATMFIILGTFGGSWGFVIAFTILGICGQIIIVLINEGSRRSNVRYYENDKYGKDKLSVFSLVALPLFILWAGYPGGIKPMVHDYNHAERIDKVLVIDSNLTLFYNDENSAFVLFVEGVKQPLMINKSGSSDTYNRLKADYLDNKIKVVKKEIKSWADDEAIIAYSLDGYNFK